jgi:hypothetical protein
MRTSFADFVVRNASILARYYFNVTRRIDAAYAQ